MITPVPNSKPTSTPRPDPSHIKEKFPQKRNLSALYLLTYIPLSQTISAKNAKNAKNKFWYIRN